jgi:hypothetical protein
MSADRTPVPGRCTPPGRDDATKPIYPQLMLLAFLAVWPVNPGLCHLIRACREAREDD